MKLVWCGGRNGPAGAQGEDVTSVTTALIDVADVTAQPATAGAEADRPLRVRRCEPTVGPAYWRWDCAACGEYGGGENHRGAMSRALRHCAEHPEHRSALLPPLRCRQEPPAQHPVLLDPVLPAGDDDEVPMVPEQRTVPEPPA